MYTFKRLPKKGALSLGPPYLLEKGKTPVTGRNAEE